MLAKRTSPGSGICKECFAYAALGGRDFVLAPVALLPALHLCLLPYDPGAETLEHLAVRDLFACLDHITDLAIAALDLQDVELPGDLRGPPGLIDLPRPRPDQLEDVSDAFLELLADARAAGLTEECTLPESLRPVLSHGDIKLDNVLVSGDRPVLIDFESLCKAPVGFDAAGFVAMLLIAVIRVRRSPDELERDKADFRSAFRRALPITAALSSYAAGRGWRPPGDEEFSRMVAWHLLHRALSEAMHRRRATDGGKLSLRLARAILSNGLETMAHASA